MPDIQKVIKGLESLRDICNAKSNMAIGKGKVAWAGYANTADDAIVLLKEQEAEEQISDDIHETAKQFRQTIVRCKDCKHGYTLTDSAFVTCGRRFHDGQKHEADWFCADGERREDDA